MTEKPAPIDLKSIFKKYIKRRYLNPVFNVLLIAVIFCCLAIVYFKATGASPFQEKSFTQTKKQSLPSPTPISQAYKPEKSPRPLPHGKKGFRVSGGNKNAPQLTGGFLDPMDPQKGTMQTITISVSNSVPVKSVTATVKTDNKETPLKMVLENGTPTSGTWKGTWNVNDTYLHKYQIQFVAEAVNGDQTVTLTLR